MCTLEIVVSTVVDVLAHLDFRVFLTYKYIQNQNRVFDVLHICHILVLYLITYDNYYSTPAIYVGFLEDQKFVMAETEFYHNCFRIFARNISTILHIIHFPLPFTCLFFVFYLINQLIFICCIG